MLFELLLHIGYSGLFIWVHTENSPSVCLGVTWPLGLPEGLGDMVAQTVASHKSVQSLRPFDPERAVERLPDPQVSRRVCSAMFHSPQSG